MAYLSSSSRLAVNWSLGKCYRQTGTSFSVFRVVRVVADFAGTASAYCMIFHPINLSEVGGKCKHNREIVFRVRVRVARVVSCVRSCGRQMCLRFWGVFRICVPLLLLLLLRAVPLALSRWRPAEEWKRVFWFGSMANTCQKQEKWDYRAARLGFRHLFFNAWHKKMTWRKLRVQD